MSYKSVPSVLLTVVLVLASPQVFAADSLSVDSASLKAVPTFESIGVYLSFSGDDNMNATCRLQYRAEGETQWRDGHGAFADYRLNAFWDVNTRQFRGSLVHLEPGTSYEVRAISSDPDGVTTTGGNSTADTAPDGTAVHLTIETSTWREAFPEGDVVAVSDRDTTLTIETAGTADAYRVYEPAGDGPATIDVAENQDHCIVINASHVIVRGLTLKGATNHAIIIAPGSHDVIIDDCEITQWGHHEINASPSHAAIHAEKGTERLIIQHNNIHDPHGGSLDWSHGHPLGPVGIEINQSKGRNVIRYNAFHSTLEHRFKDILGGSNDGASGSLKQDSDVYGNLMGDCYDDVLEVEGFDMNIRIWGNVVKDGFKGISTANIGYTRSHGVDSSLGPIYVFRNLFMNLASTANKIRGDGGYYFYHNTILPSVADGGEWPSKARSPEIPAFGVVKNNIVASAPKAFRYELVEQPSGAKWFFDHNLYAVPKAAVTLRPGWEANGLFGVAPRFEPEGFDYYLRADAPGVDAGERIPNFSDRFTGSGPDIGASERDAFSLRVGPHGAGKP